MKQDNTLAVQWWWWAVAWWYSDCDCETLVGRHDFAKPTELFFTIWYLV